MPSRKRNVATEGPRGLAPQIARALERMKWEIATEFGITLGPDTPSRLNGAVGGEMVKRMVAFAESSLSGQGSTGVH